MEALNEDDTPIVNHCAAVVEMFEGAIKALDSRADHHRPLGRRGDHPGADGPRLRGGGRGAELGADRRRADRAAVAGEVHLAGAEEPRQPPQGGRLHVRAVELRVHQRPPGGAGRRLRALPRAGLRPGPVRQRHGQLHPGPQDTAVDYKNDDRAPLLFVSGSEDHIMPPSIQKSNLKHYKSDTVTEITEYEGPHLMIAPRAGRRSPTTCWSGPSSTRDERRADHAHRRPHRAAGSRRLAAADRPHVRPGGRELPLRLGHRVEEAGRSGGGPGRPGPDRRGAAEPRPARGQPGRRRAARSWTSAARW